MTKREAKRRILGALVRTLDNDVIAGNAGWPFVDEDGADLSQADEDRMIDAAQDLMDEFARRGAADSQQGPDA